MAGWRRVVYCSLVAAVAQWIERFPPEEEVGGSNPFSRASYAAAYRLRGRRSRLAQLSASSASV